MLRPLVTANWRPGRLLPQQLLATALLRPALLVALSGGVPLVYLPHKHPL